MNSAVSERRRIVALLLLLPVFCLSAFSQVGERRSDFSLGVNGGVNLAKMDFSPTIKQNYLTTPVFGLSARYVCEKYFSTICAVQVELNYTQAGWDEKIIDGSGNTYKRTLDYVQLPMLMQLGWGKEQRGMKFIFTAGPVLQYLIGNTEKKGGGVWNPDNRPNNVVYQYSNKPDFNIDYGIMAGAGVELSTSIGHFLLEGRYYFGLGDIYDNSKKGYFERSANQVITGKLTYLFDMNKKKQ